MSQIAFPSAVTALEISRETTLGGAIALCARAAGLEPKQIQDELKADRAQFSRWTGNTEGIVWPKLLSLMDCCGNDAPLLWMLDNRGYDIGSLRRKETETARQLREARERISELEHEREIERRLFKELRSAA